MAPASRNMYFTSLHEPQFWGCLPSCHPCCSTQLPASGRESSIPGAIQAPGFRLMRIQRWVSWGAPIRCESKG